MADERLNEVASPQLVESLDADSGKDGGWHWRVALIEEGRSDNGRLWPDRIIESLVPHAEGAKAHDGHLSQAERMTSSTKAVVGWYDKAATERGKDGTLRLMADFHILESARWLRDSLRSAWDAGKKDLLGFSIFAKGKSRIGRDEKGPVRIVEEVYENPPVTFDVVDYPAAGGRVERLVAGGIDEEEDEIKVLAEMTAEELKEARPDLVEALIKEAKGSEDPPEEEEEESSEDEESKDEDESTDEEEESEEEVKESKKPKDGGDRLQEATDRVLKTACSAELREALSQSKLPEPTIKRLQATYEGTIFEAKELTKAIKAEKDYLASFTEAGITGFGETRDVQVIKDEQDKKGHALDGFFAGEDIEKQPAYTSFKEAYEDVTGNHRTPALDIIQESRPGPSGTGTPWEHLTEALTTGSWAQVLGDSIARRMIAEYRVPGLDDWRKVVSEVVPVTDFRTNRRGRIGGYGTLPTISEGETYQNLTSPTDEEATYAVSKKGGLETLTEETIANDDVGAIRRIPRKLARAAAQTLYRGVFDTFTANAAVTYDSVALFHADHGNLGSTALSSAELSVVKRILAEVAAYNDSTEVLGLSPKYILHPAELTETVFRLIKATHLIGGANNDPNIHSTYGLQGIEVPYWTDANNWYTVANPQDVPTIEVGFYLGKQEPELWVQDQATDGSTFSADKITYKIRHIWQVCVLDHRGMYGEVVA